MTLYWSILTPFLVNFNPLWVRCIVDPQWSHLWLLIFKSVQRLYRKIKSRFLRTWYARTSTLSTSKCNWEVSSALCTIWKTLFNLEIAIMRLIFHWAMHQLQRPYPNAIEMTRSFFQNLMHQLKIFDPLCNCNRAIGLIFPVILSNNLNQMQLQLLPTP